MLTLEYPETDKWVVAHNNDDIFHISKVTPETVFTTGQPYMNVFDTKEDLLITFPFLSAKVF